MNKLLLCSISVALAGFLFGFDTIVISGADLALQEMWNSTDFFHGFVVMSMALWGTVIGAIFGSIPTDKFGRKNTLIGIGVLFLISALGSAFANDPYSFAFFRFIGGIGVGVSTITAPAYIAEIAPQDKRGRLVALYQLSIVVGILVALLSNFLLSNLGENSWRWMLGVEALPALLYCILINTVPKSPRWLVLNNKLEEAKESISYLGLKLDINSFTNDVNQNNATKAESIFLKKYRKALLLAFSIAFFNQLSGINALLYYAPRIFEEAGLAKNAALLNSVGIGVVNVVFTLIGMALIDRWGRKRLLYWGSIGYIISLSLVAFSFYFEWKGVFIPLFLFLFIAAHALGQGTVIWVFIAELFPTHLRASGQAFGSSVHWILAAFIPSMIPFLFSSIGATWVFIIFAVMMVFQLLWVHFKMPETKGNTLEQLSDRLSE